MMRQLLKDKYYWLTLFVGAAIFYALNLNTCLWADDYEYSLMPGNLNERCDTLAKYFATVHYFYIDTNGRIADMILRFIDSLLGRAVFNVLNTLVFVTLVHLLTCLVSTTRRVWLPLVVYLFALTLMPRPGETMLWMPGAVNYMWTSAATMGVLLYLKRSIASGNAIRPMWHHVVVAVCAFVAGGLNESFSSAMMATMVCYFVIYRKELRGTCLTLMVAYALGMCVILFSPAAWNRLDTGNSVNFNMGITQLVLQRTYNLFAKTGHFVTPLLGFAAIAVMWWRKGLKHTSHNLLHWTVVGAAASVWVLGVYQYRAYVCYSLMGFVVALGAIASMLEHRRRETTVVGVVAAIGCLVPTAGAIATGREYKSFNDSVIAEVIASPDGVIHATRELGYSRYYPEIYFDNRRATWFNKFIGYYYGKDNVQFLGDSVYARYRGNAPFMAHSQRLDNYASSHPHIAPHIYSMGSAEFSVIPIVGDSVVERQGLSGRLYYEDMAEHLGTDRARLRKMWGVLKDYEQFPMYHLKRDGNYYVVLPAMCDSIVRVDVFMKVAGRNETLTFTQQ